MSAKIPADSRHCRQQHACEHQAGALLCVARLLVASQSTLICLAVGIQYVTCCATSSCLNITCFYRALQMLGVHVGGPRQATFNGLHLDLYPRVTWSPLFAMTIDDIKVCINLHCAALALPCCATSFTRLRTRHANIVAHLHGPIIASESPRTEKGVTCHIHISLVQQVPVLHPFAAGQIPFP